MSGTPAKLKAIQTQLRKHEQALAELDQQQNQLDRDKNRKAREIEDLNLELAKLKNKEQLLVSEHALLRYLERVRGIDLDQVKDEILNEEIVELASQLNFADADIPSKTGGFKVRIKQRTIVTILTRNG